MGDDLWSPEKLALFLAFILPGFVSLKIFDLLVPRPERDATHFLINAVAYSALNYGVFLWPIWFIQQPGFRDTHYVLYWGAWYVILIGAPACWSLLYVCMVNRKVLPVPHPAHRAWDWVFSKQESYWVVIRFKDGTVVGGRYLTNSAASGAPAEEQIYLEELWKVDQNGKFLKQIKRTAGGIIFMKDVVSVELFK